MNNTPDNQKSPWRAPSARVTAALAAAMLGIGVAVGAAIGPAPSPSQASSSLPLLLTTLAREAAVRAAQAASAAAQPTATTAEATTPARKRHKRRHEAPSTEEASTAASTPASETETETSTPSSTTPKSKTKASELPPVTHVWLIELAGTSFEQALAQPAAAPYVDTEAVAAGTLLSGWSGLEGSAFANDAALLAGSSPQLLDTIVQPPCPASAPEEGTAGASCTSEAGELTTADEFLKATIPTITSSAAFRESGLIVVTFASVGLAAQTSLPAGATTATLTSQPPAGVLLISPFVGVGAKSAASFNPTSPKQVLEKLLRR